MKKKITPIEEGLNLGRVSGSELQSVGVESLEQLIEMGWEEAFIKLTEYHPHRLNLNMLTSLIGAIENQSWKDLDPPLKAEAKQFLNRLKRQKV